MIRKLLLNQSHWEKTAIIDGDETITYGELARRSFAIRAKLSADAGNNVAILLPNSGDYIAALFGVLMGGFTVFPLNIMLTNYEIESLLVQTKVKTVVTSKEFRPIFNQLKTSPEIIYVEDIAPWDIGVFSAVPADPRSPMVLLSTSGTSGKAKIVMLSELNLESCVINFIDRTNRNADGAEKRYLVCTPFSSAYGTFILPAIMMRGYTIILMREQFTLDTFYRMIERYKVTHCETGTAAITLMAQNAERPIPYDISSARWYGFGGSGIDKEMLLKLYETFPWAEFWNGYGMTETSALVSKVNKRLYGEQLSSVGTAIKNMEIMVEVDGVKVDTPFVKGEVVVKGSNIMLGYYENEAETAKMIRDGWLYTGDVGYLDEDKYLYLCGRIKNIILVRGFTVYAEEVEACILNSGLARDCFVYSKPDRFDNEQVCADVIPMGFDVTLENIGEWCNSHLAAYKCPQQIFLKDSLDKTSTGKTKRM